MAISKHPVTVTWKIFPDDKHVKIHTNQPHRGDRKLTTQQKSADSELPDKQYICTHHHHFELNRFGAGCKLGWLDL